jgi:hypothetical protein
MHKLIITFMDTNARWQKLPKSNLSLRRRREVAVTKRLVAYATSEDKKLPVGNGTDYNSSSHSRTVPVHKGAYSTKIRFHIREGQ